MRFASLMEPGKGRPANMYCPNCGGETSEGLNYCKACGSSLSVRPEPPVRRSISFKEILLFLIIAVLGLIAPIGLFIESEEIMKRGQAPISVSTTMFGLGALLSFLTVLLLAWLFLRMISPTSSRPELGKSKDKALPPSPNRVSQIRIGKESLPSVTEHTTRSFEESFRNE